MLRRKSRSSAENEIVSRKIKTSAEFSALSLKIQKFSWRSETSRTSRKVLGLRRISSDSFEFPSDDSDFQRKNRNAADNSRQAAEKRDFQESIGPAACSGENSVDVRQIQRFFCARSRKKPDPADNFLTHERHLFRSLQIDCAGGYLDSRSKDSAGGRWNTQSRR